MRVWLWLEIVNCLLLYVVCLHSKNHQKTNTNSGIHEVLEDFGSKNFSLSSGNTEFKLSFPVKPTNPNLCYFNLRFKELPTSDSNIKMPREIEKRRCPEMLNTNGDVCQHFVLKLSSGDLHAKEEHVNGSWCDEIPTKELIIYTESLFISLVGCSSGTQSFRMDFLRVEVGNFKFQIDAYRDVQTLNLLNGKMETVMEFRRSTNQIDIPLQIQLDPWVEKSSQQISVYDDRYNPDLGIGFVGSWRGQLGEPLVYRTESSIMYVRYRSFKKYANTMFNIKVQGYCLPGYLSCGDQINCYKEAEYCDGKRDCPNSQDETGCNNMCEPTDFSCGNMLDRPQCVAREKTCDGFVDCPNREDEKDCLECNATTSLKCASVENSRYFNCYQLSGRCNQVNDCLDKSDEEGCPPTRKVITASTIGGLICGVLFACALGCSMRLFGLRNANARRHSLALQQTPIGRMTRRLLQREAPPSYSMAVHGREQEESTSRRHRRHQNGESSSSQRRHRRRHRRRRSEIRIRRSQPCAADLATVQRPAVSSPADLPPPNNRQCRGDGCDHLLCNESNENTTPTPSPRRNTTRPRDNLTTIVEEVDETPSTVSTLPSSTMFSFTHGGSIVNFPLARICTHVPTATIPRASTPIQVIQRAAPVSPQHTTNNISSHEVALVQLSETNNNNATTANRKEAPPLPKKRPIKPVMVAAPCDDVTVDQSPACIYPNPPSYKEAVKGSCVPLHSCAYIDPQIAQSLVEMHNGGAEHSPSSDVNNQSANNSPSVQLLSIQRGMIETGNEVLRSHQSGAAFTSSTNHRDEGIISFHVNDTNQGQSRADEETN